MSITRPNLIIAAQRIAQDPADNKNNLLQTPADYELTVGQALITFGSDRPNRRIVHYTVTAAAFRFVLSGDGAILPTALASLDRWIEGGSRIDAVFYPYLTSVQNQQPIDGASWRELREPGLVIIELLDATTIASGILRLEYVRPHVVDATAIARTSVREADLAALETLVAAEICAAAARRYVQNTGTSAFQNETIDRRTQSDVMASRAKDLRASYDRLVGRGSGGSTGDAGVAAAAVVRRFDVEALNPRGFMWPRRG